MTASQKRDAVKLIRNLCSYCDNGNCIYLDKGETVVCPQSISYTVCCKFFRNVLLEDPQGKTLKAEIFKDNALKRCTVCGQTFSSESNNAKYCKTCSTIIHRQQKAEHARKRRSIVEK